MSEDQTTVSGEFRVEHDSMGEVMVPLTAKWAAQTQRAVQNFPISGLRIDDALVRSLAAIKGAAALQNAELGTLDAGKAEAIAAVAEEIRRGKWSDQFPVDVFQTGSGTSSNMNMNEVLANLATERLGSRVHPNDDVNASQSSNDTFPSAIHVAAVYLLVNDLKPALEHLAGTLEAKAEEFAEVVKSGRTHLMDATPVTLGQEFGGYAASIRNGIERVDAGLPRVGELPLGGTAVGTGINALPEFAPGVIARLAKSTGLPLSEARNHFEAQGSRDALVEASGHMRTIAISMYKMVNDIRWMSSGPRTGLSEIRIPDLQPGSSIMPGKVNPVVPEAVCQVVAQVVGNDAAVAFGASAGNFELNVMLPVIARNLLESIKLLASVAIALADKCVSGIEANVERCRQYAESSPSVGTSLNTHIGYDQAAKVIKKSLAENKTLREVLIEDNIIDPKDIDTVLDVMAMTKGGVI
jgi:fumarate hydratase, class II